MLSTQKLQLFKIVLVKEE